MASRKHMLKLIRHYKIETGEKEIDMHKVAEYARSKGWPMPKPANPIDILAKQFSQAAREEMRYDRKTGRPYRANHAFREWHGGTQLTLWVDIDEIGRKPMLKCLVQRREQMVGDGLQLTLDAEHWNAIHLDEEPINLPLDLTPDIEWRKNAPDEDGKAA